MPRANLFVIGSAIALSFLILELVRRRRLREEYSWLWILAAILYTLSASWPDFGLWLARIVGSSNPVSAFAFLALSFLLLICVQFSVQISRLTEQNKNLMQQLAILDGEFKALSAQWEGSEPDQVSERGETDQAHPSPAQGAPVPHTAGLPETASLPPAAEAIALSTAAEAASLLPTSEAAAFSPASEAASFSPAADAASFPPAPGPLARASLPPAPGGPGGVPGQ